MANKKNPLEFLKSSFSDWLDNSGSDMGIPRFEDNEDMAIQRMIGGASPLRDQKMGEKALGTIFDEERKALEDRRITVTEYNQRIDAKLTKFLDALTDVVDDDVLTSLEQTATQIRAAGNTVAQLSSQISPDKLRALMPAIGGFAASNLNETNREKFEQQVLQIAQDPNLDTEKAQAEIGKVLRVLTEQQILGSPASMSALAGGRVRDLSKETRNAETGSEQQQAIDRQISGGIRGAIKRIRQVEALEKQDSFLSTITGTGKGAVGIDRNEAQAALAEGIKQSKEQIANSRAAIEAAKAEIAKLKRTSGGSDADIANRNSEIEKYDAVIAAEEQRMGELVTGMSQAAATLNKPLQDSLNQVGVGMKSAFSAFVSGFKELGDFLYRSIMQLGKATLNPVVTDLFESLKLGLDIGLKAGQLIYTMTKGTLDGLSNMFGMGGFLPQLLGRGVGNLANQGGPAGQVGGWLQRAGSFLGKAVTGASIAGGGYLASELIGGGIRLLGGNRQNEDGTFTAAGKKNEMWASTLQGAGQVASIGAGIGSFFGPLGTAVGAGIGALIGGVSGYSKGASVVDDSKARDAYIKQKEAEDRQKKLSAYQAGAFVLPGLDPNSLNAGNAFEKFSAAIPNLANNLDKLGLGLGGGALLSIAGGKTGFGNVGRTLMAALGGAGGGVAVGMAVATVDFFLKQLNRGAEGMMKFADISNNLNVGLNYQMRSIGNVSSGGKGGLGNRGLMTEADFSQYVYDFMSNRGLGNLGYKTEDVARMFQAGSQTSLMGLTDLNSAVESAAIMSRQLGVSADSLLKAYGEADKSFGVGQGEDVFNRLLYGAAARSGSGQPNAMSLEITQALISAGRQMQMAGPQTMSSGANYANFMGGLYRAVTSSGSDYGQFIEQNPEALTTITDSINNLFKSGITGGNQLGLALATSAGLSAREALEFGATSDARTFEAGVGAIMSAIPSSFFEGGKVTEQALNDYLPYLLPGMGLNGPVAGYAEMFELAMSGDIAGAQKALEKTKPENEQLKALELINKTTGEGINKLIAEQNRAEQQTLQLMEDNISELVDLSKAATDAGNSLLKIGNQFMGPAISMLTSGVNWLGVGLDKLQEMLGGDSGSSGTGGAIQTQDQFVKARALSGGLIASGDEAIGITKSSLGALDWVDYFTQQGSSTNISGQARKDRIAKYVLEDIGANTAFHKYATVLDTNQELQELYSFYGSTKNVLGSVRSADQLSGNINNPAVLAKNFGLGVLGLSEGDSKITGLAELFKGGQGLKLSDGSQEITFLEWLLTDKEKSMDKNRLGQNFNALLKGMNFSDEDIAKLLMTENLIEVYGRDANLDYDTAIATVMGGGKNAGNELLNALNNGGTVLLAIPEGTKTMPVDELNSFIQNQINANKSAGGKQKP